MANEQPDAAPWVYGAGASRTVVRPVRPAPSADEQPDAPERDEQPDAG